jgi:hypothetical protein
MDKFHFQKKHAVFPGIWDRQFKFMKTFTVVPKHKRGIYRSTQQYDPFVYESLKHFNCDLLQECKGYTRVAGSEREVRDRLDQYDRPEYKMPHTYRHAYTKALAVMRHQFKLEEKVIPTWIPDVEMIKSTSSGYPHYQKKGQIEDKIRQEGRFLFHLMKRLDYSNIKFPFATPAVRGASRPSEETKTRLVWMYPAAMLLSEGVFAQPLIKRYYNDWFKHDLFLTGRNGKFKHRQYCGRANEKKDDITIGHDFSSFDTFNCTEVIRDVFSILNENIAHGYYKDSKGVIEGGTSGVEARSRKAWANIVEYFIRTPIVLPNGKVIRKESGIPSGSNFTNLIDSMINYLAHLTMSFHHGIRFNLLRTNGDDSLFTVKNNLRKQEWYSLMETGFKQCFNLILNTEKSCYAEVPSQIHASGTEWNNLDPYRTTVGWLRLALNAKSYTRNSLEGFQRLFGIGVVGGFRDPTYCRFFNYYQTGYNCKTDLQKFDWTKYRWIEMVFGEIDLPRYFKASSTMLKLAKQAVT